MAKLPPRPPGFGSGKMVGFGREKGVEMSNSGEVLTEEQREQILSWGRVQYPGATRVRITWSSGTEVLGTYVVMDAEPDRRACKAQK